MRDQFGTCLVEMHYLPTVQYMSKFLLYGEVVIEAHENYQKSSYRNRMGIVGPNGTAMLSVPLRSGKHQQKPIREVEIAYDEPWYAVHWKSIAAAYGRAPYFLHYSPGLEEVLKSHPRYLYDLNRTLMNWLIGCIGLDGFSESEAYQKLHIDKDDLRNLIKPGSTDDDPNFRVLPYFQMFDDRMEFVPNLSILDLLFAMGPETKSHLRQSLVLGC